METKTSTKRRYKTFDQSDAIKQAQKLIDRTKKKQTNLRSIRIDADTVVQIKAERSNVDRIIERVKHKARTVSIVDQIEYGQYA
ncbi:MULTISPECIES: hypothetical protein [unclassified Dysgonomonas]|uniref:hypothetical protein n=1 Tax=unclassified Dysgonomonas TaxID=2630389 RepID=UPI0006819196|nr:MULTISPECIES: hypothetical protein [unclassified Dysgonomonas]MBD8349407.1 hypothetical protein [Dysgonomonas sp. HGC4]MBF0577990.1 hypothetical protein [Dysgonomonas sp. GY617]